MTDPKVPCWSKHKCGCPHTDPSSWLKCAYPFLTIAGGTGKFVAATFCKPARAKLFETSTEAATAKDTFDAKTCGTGCKGKHNAFRIWL